MKRIFIACVNYNSYGELAEYLKSIEIAYNQVQRTELDLIVSIADNSKVKENICLDGISYKVNIVPLDNAGYFGGASFIINNRRDIPEFDYVIISNVDLKLDINFFNNLPDELESSVAWISPSILSSYEKRDKGRGLAERPTKRKLKQLKFMYRHPWLHFLIEHTYYRRKTLANQSDLTISEIYSGHGSLIILTKAFFSVYRKINYPVFLYGEELFLGELIRQKGLKVLYNPNIIIYDSEHVSTSLLPSSFSSKYQYESISYIMDTFYKNE